MNLGPVEYLELAFPGNQFNGEILPALQNLVERDIIAIIDLVIVKKDADGTITIAELSEMPESEAALFAPLQAEMHDLLSADDIEDLALDLPNNYTAALLVFENSWAARFTEAVRDSGGILIANARVPHDVVMAALEAAND